MYSFQEIREMVHPHLRNKPGYYLTVLSGNRFEISFHAPGASLENAVCTCNPLEARWYNPNSFDGISFQLPLVEEFLSLITWTIKDGIFYAILQYTKPERYVYEERQALIPEQYKAVRDPKGAFVSPSVAVMG